MHDLIEKFGLGVVQDTVNVIKYLKKRESTAAAESLLVTLMGTYKKEREQKNKKLRVKWLKEQPKCPKCKSIQVMREIKKVNKYNYKSHFICTNDNCLDERYSRKTLIEELKLRK